MQERRDPAGHRPRRRWPPPALRADERQEPSHAAASPILKDRRRRRRVSFGVVEYRHRPAVASHSQCGFPQGSGGG